MPNPTLTHLEYCTYCPKMCRHACPVSTATARESLIPQAKMAALNVLRKGQAPWQPESTEPLWACTGCRQCTSTCANGVDPGATLFAGRDEAVRRGVGHAALDRYPERFRAREERLVKQAQKGFPREKFAETAQVALWPGCDSVDKGEADVLAQLALLERLGDAHVRLVESSRMCGGYPLLAAGQPEAFRWHATRVAQELARYRTVIVSCSACVHTLRTVYPREGLHLSAEILHAAEYFQRHVDRLHEPAEKAPAWYHDPCYLARHANVTVEPRRLLARVAEVREFGWSHADTECCGGGGLLPKTMPTVADEMARRRLREVAEQGGGTVVTSCGTCKHMLARNAPANVVVRDLVEYVEERSRN